MVAISTLPTIVDVTHYGGDTFTIEVRAAPEVTNGMQWDAHLKSSRDVDVIDATFSILPPAVAGDPAYVTLSSVDCARLVSDAPVVTRRSVSGATLSIKKYVGVWDVQVSHAVDPDPVRTLLQGSFSIEVDVTRPA